MKAQPTVSNFFSALAKQPFVQPVVSLAHSRRFALIVLAVIANLLLPTIPGITPERLTLLQNVIIVGGGILLTGYSVENVIEARATLPTTSQEAIKQIAGELVTAVESVKPAEPAVG